MHVRQALFTLALAPSILGASTLPTDSTPAPDSETSLFFDGFHVTGEAHRGAVSNTAASRGDSAVQAALAAEGLAVADPLECTALVPLDDYYSICTFLTESGKGGGHRVLRADGSGPAYQDAPEALVVAWHDLATLPIETGTVTTQFDPGVKPLIHVEVPTMSSATTHTLTMTLLDTAVEIRLTPVEWAWDFGHEDVPNITTRTPGGRYPDLTVAPIYEHGAHDITISTTITWHGEYRIAGTETWYPVLGAGTTSATSEPFDTRQYRTYLLPSPTYNGPGPTWADNH